MPFHPTWSTWQCIWHWIRIYCNSMRKTWMAWHSNGIFMKQTTKTENCVWRIFFPTIFYSNHPPPRFVPITQNVVKLIHELILFLSLSWMMQILRLLTSHCPGHGIIPNQSIEIDLLQQAIRYGGNFSHWNLLVRCACHWHFVNQIDFKSPPLRNLASIANCNHKLVRIGGFVEEIWMSWREVLALFMCHSRSLALDSSFEEKNTLMSDSISIRSICGLLIDFVAKSTATASSKMCSTHDRRQILTRS